MSGFVCTYACTCVCTRSVYACDVIKFGFICTEDDFSCLVINFIFERRLAHFLIQVVAPSVLLVSVAYFSCWIRLDSGPGRYLLTILTLLSLVTIYNGYKSDLPKSSYLLVSSEHTGKCSNVQHFLHILVFCKR